MTIKSENNIDVKFVGTPAILLVDSLITPK
jgi:hypothetical protein